MARPPYLLYRAESQQFWPGVPARTLLPVEVASLDDETYRLITRGPNPLYVATETPPPPEPVAAADDAGEAWTDAPGGYWQWVWTFFPDESLTTIPEPELAPDAEPVDEAFMAIPAAEWEGMAPAEVTEIPDAIPPKKKRGSAE